MRTFLVVALFALSSIACTEGKSVIQDTTAYGYLKNIGVPEAERIRQAEERNAASRIVGGVPAGVGQYVYQAGLLISLVGSDGTAVCGGSLVSAEKVITAAHCWFDGQTQAWRITTVLGTVTLFSGGTRLDSSVVVMHPNWNPSLARNDVAVIYLPHIVHFSNTIGPIPLPTGSQLFEDYVGDSAIASGFGKTSDAAGISTNQVLSHVRLNVITNSICSFSFPLIIQNSNICTSGIGGVGTCGGDSGGPLTVSRNGKPILIGITSFGSVFGCEANLPAAFARVTSFMDFFNQHM